VQLPNSIARKAIILEDQFFDLKGLAEYSSLRISSLRYHIRENQLPVYSILNEKKAVTKILVKRSEFDEWMKWRWRDYLDEIVNEAIKEIPTKKGGKKS